HFTSLYPPFVHFTPLYNSFNLLTRVQHKVSLSHSFSLITSVLLQTLLHFFLYFSTHPSFPLLLVACPLTPGPTQQFPNRDTLCKLTVVFAALRSLLRHRRAHHSHMS
ncbi:hypothetical protein BS17DRAFT_872722, partial [Gyrodon lividus]